MKAILAPQKRSSWERRYPSYLIEPRAAGPGAKGEGGIYRARRVKKISREKGEEKYRPRRFNLRIYQAPRGKRASRLNRPAKVKYNIPPGPGGRRE